jgi:hypothetical protein
LKTQHFVLGYTHCAPPARQAKDPGQRREARDLGHRIILAR